MTVRFVKKIKIGQKFLMTADKILTSKGTIQVLSGAYIEVKIVVKL
jgi:hypothetical protein